MASSAAQLGVPGVAQRVAEEVEAQDGQADGQAGKDRQPRRLLHEGAAGAAEHQAPRGRGRLGADAEEAQRGLDEDRVASQIDAMIRIGAVTFGQDVARR